MCPAICGDQGSFSLIALIPRLAERRLFSPDILRFFNGWSLELPEHILGLSGYNHEGGSPKLRGLIIMSASVFI